MKDVVLRLAVVAAVTLASCSTPSSQPPETDAVGTPSDNAGSGSGVDHAGPGRARRDGKGSSERGPGTDANVGSGRAHGGNDTDNGGAASTDETESGNQDASAALVYPATGRYVYDQSGYEEFCTGTCERSDLPRSQPVDIFHEERSNDSAVVVSQAQTSDSRMARTTVEFSGKRAAITEIFTRFDYEGFSFSETIQPDPAIESLRFPLRTGTRWTGAWDDEISGTYRIAIGERTTVSVGGTSAEAIRIDSTSTFSGRYEGETQLTVWLDVATNNVVRTAGRIDVSSTYGRYISEFETALRKGPGY